MARLVKLAAVVLVLAAAACAANPRPTGLSTTESATAAPPDLGTTSTVADSATSAAMTVAAPALVASTVATLPRQERSFTMAFSGDTLVHRPIVRTAAEYAAASATGAPYDFTPMFSRIAPLITSVDLAVCHMETPIAPPGEELSGHPIYGVPAEVLDAVAAAGYDRCSTASNHTLDRGLKGIDATVNKLEAVGLGNAGMARTPAESEPQVFTVREVKMSHIAYTWGYNGIPMPAGQEWRAKLLNADRIINDARVARSRGAEFVFASLHWGDEKNWRVTAEQRRIAEKVTASGVVDLIVGHHVHVLQPIEEINGRWVVFGLSNILSNLPGGDPDWPASSQDGAVVTVEVAPNGSGGWNVSRPIVHATWVDPKGYIVRFTTEIDSPETSIGLAAELERSRERTRLVLGDYLAPCSLMFDNDTMRVDSDETTGGRC